MFIRWFIGSVTFLNLRKILRACKGFSSFNGINSTLFEITQSYENREPFLYLRVTDLLSFFAQILEMISTRIVVPWLPSKWRWLEIFYFKLKTPICLISVFRDGLFYCARKCLLFLQLIYHINQLTKGRSWHRCIEWSEVQEIAERAFSKFYFAYARNLSSLTLLSLIPWSCSKELIPRPTLSV